MWKQTYNLCLLKLKFRILGELNNEISYFESAPYGIVGIESSRAYVLKDMTTRSELLYTYWVALQSLVIAFILVINLLIVYLDFKTTD